jgi:hypothetical protein
MGAGHAQDAVELVEAPQNFDPQIILADPATPEKACRSVVTGASVDAHDPQYKTSRRLRTEPAADHLL